MKKLLSIIFCIGIILCLASCQYVNPKNTEESSASTEPVASFNTVEDFKIATKKNPKLYIDKYVTVKGYASKSIVTDLLYDDPLANDEKYDGRTRIIISIEDSVLRAVLEDRDYIEVTGKVTMSETSSYGEKYIYLSDCTYTMITASEERQ